MVDRELVETALASVKNAADVEFFFNSLTSPEWIPFLEEKNLFRSPPPPLKEGQYISFPIWPQSKYLKRMAATAPKEVLRIILAVPETENVRVHEDFLDAALEMPSKLADSISGKAIEWISSPYLLLPDKTGALAAHLANGGHLDSALRILEELLAVQEDPRSIEMTAFRVPPEPIGRVHEWEYKRILDQYVPQVIAAAGLRGLHMLGTILAKAVTLSLREDTAKSQMHDFSYIWRPAIEDHSQNLDHGVREHLVSAIRDSAVSIVLNNGILLPKVIGELEQWNWPVFKRIALHVLGTFPNESVSIALSRLLEADNINSVDLYHEFWKLARELFPALDENDQLRFLALVEEEYTKDDLAASRDRQDQDQNDATRLAHHTFYRHLVAIGEENLPASYVAMLKELQGEFGRIEVPDFLVSHEPAAWIGQESPRSKDDLALMPIDDLVNLLRDWKPSGNLREATVEGLGQILQQVVSESPERFATEASFFKGLDPTYLRAVVTGLTSALKSGQSFPWQPVLDLCSWIVQQPREIPGRSVTFHDLDPHWGWTRRAIADLFYTAFDPAFIGIPFLLRESIWDILVPLTEDEDPTPEYEDQYGDKNLEPTTLSINATRGAAIHSVIRYALWVRRQIESESNPQDRLLRGFSEMPEVRSVLETHLDPFKDPSPSIRSIYGQWFPWLVLLDPNWAGSRVSKVFPEEESQWQLLDAAWNAYIVFTQPYDNVFPVLRGEYIRAIYRIGREKFGERQSGQADARLAEHLMTYYWRGKISLDDPTDLLALFYNSASAELRRHALDFVGRALYGKEKPPVPDRVRDLLEGLWISRLQTTLGILAPERSKELSAFGWWFASRKFADEWALTQLITAINAAGKLEASHLVLEQLATMVSDYPQQVLEAVTLLIAAEKDNWALSLGGDSLEVIIRDTVKSSDRSVRERAIDLLQLLAAKGHREFANLLTEANRGPEEAQ